MKPRTGDPSGNARDRRRIWRARGRLLNDALAGRVGPLQGAARWSKGGIVHYAIEPRRPKWARRLTRAEWRNVVEWGQGEYPMARAFRAAALREAGDEAGARALYGGGR